MWGRTHDLSILGLGKSELDGVFQEAATARGLRIIPDQVIALFMKQADSHLFAPNDSRNASIVVMTV